MAKPVIVLDWGDTLMVNYPQYDGPMASWPEVAAVPGAVETLARLSSHYDFVVATNAQASSAEQVRAALDRVSLGQFIRDIFTMHELHGYCKPQPEYFHHLQKLLGVLPTDLTMFGDDPLIDGAGSAQCGWRAGWLNGTPRPAPGLLPSHDFEVSHWISLPEGLARPRLPGLQDCRNWLLGQGATPALLLHIDLVAALAYQLAVWLRNAGQKVDPILAHRGGLLHDLAKLSSRGTGLDHGELAGRLLDARGEDVLARIARTHVLFNLMDERVTPRTWEEKLVYYADKLVEKGGVVSIEVRLAALQHRYRIEEEKVNRCIQAIHDLEMEICTPLKLMPQELLARLQSAFIGD